LWRLQELNNWDKHRTIHTTTLLVHKGSAQALHGVNGEVKGVMITPNGPFEDHTPIGGVLLNPRQGLTFDEWVYQVEVQFNLSIGIAFKEPTPSANESVVEVVGAIGKRVGDILEGIDEAFFR
jgi:hypothetical protein